MVTTRGVDARTPFSWPAPERAEGAGSAATTPSPFAPFTPFTPFASPFARRGFALDDQLLAPTSTPRALGPLAPTARAQAPAGDSALARSAQSRLQQIHQTERRAGARTARAMIDPPAPQPVKPTTVKVGGKTYRHGQGDRLWLNLSAKGKSYEKWAKKHPAAARLVGSPTRIYREIRALRRDFQRVGSPLAKYARHFVTAGHLSGYDPKFIAAFAALESGWGRSTPANAPYNFWGWSVYTGQQSSAVSSPFKSPGRAFRYFGRELGKHYGGAKSVYSPIWAPYAADPSHERSIAQIMRDYFGGNPNDIRFPKRLRDR